MVEPSDRNIKSWQEQIPGAFAGMPSPFTANFASHPKDRKRAIRMLLSAKIEGASKKNILSATKSWLVGADCKLEFIDQQLDRVEQLYKEILELRPKKSAWLVMWDGTSVDKWAQEKRIVAVFDARTSPEKIRSFMEEYYKTDKYSLEEKVRFSSNPKKKQNPYPAEFQRVGDGNFLKSITCGHNPFLNARIVEQLIVSHGTDTRTLHWIERQ